VLFGVARRLEQRQPLDLPALDLLQQPVDEPMVGRRLQGQQPPR
jgi:hypothetical protein